MCIAMLALQRARRIQGTLHLVLPGAVERATPYLAIAHEHGVDLNIYTTCDGPTRARTQAHSYIEVFTVQGGGAAGLAAVIQRMIDRDSPPHVVVDPDGSVLAALDPKVSIAQTPAEAITELCS